MDSEQLAALYEKFCDGTLSPEETAEFKARLQSEQGQAEFKELALQSSAMHDALEGGRRASQSNTPAASVAQAKTNPWRWLATAALLALVLGGAYWSWLKPAAPPITATPTTPTQPVPPPTAALTTLSQAKDVTLTRAGAVLPLIDQTDLQAGDELATGATGSGAVRFADGSQLNIGNNSSLTLLPANARAFVRSGRLQVQVTPQVEGQSFVLRTAQSTARVLGTEFRLQVTPEFTRLAVQTGAVQVDSPRQAKSLVVRPQEFIITRADGTLSHGAVAGTDRLLSDFERGEAEDWMTFIGKSPRGRARSGAGHNSAGALELQYASDPTQGAGAYWLFGPSQDWSAYDGISFWFYGENTGNDIKFEIFDNFGKGAHDAWERFIYPFKDDTHGWRKRTVFWNEFKRNASQSGSPPDDGLTLVEMYGMALITVGRGLLRLDDIRLMRIAE